MKRAKERQSILKKLASSDEESDDESEDFNEGETKNNDDSSRPPRLNLAPTIQIDDSFLKIKQGKRATLQSNF